MEKMNLTPKQYKVLTWMEDVEGLTNRIEGDELIIFYAIAPDFFEKRISLEDVAATIHDIYDLEEDKYKLN